MEPQPIPEIDVIGGVIRWLHSEGWQVKKVSLPKGQGISQHKQKEILRSISCEKISTSPGPDIEAASGDEIWKIECKGLGNVAPSTLKNNFDRAVASAVSYYTERDGLRIGLALPEAYKHFIQNKLPQPFREAIKLWTFLYITGDEVYVWKPDERLELE